MIEEMRGVNMREFFGIEGPLYIATPVPSDSDVVHNCKIKVGPRRFIPLDLNTERAKIIVWNEEDEANPYSCETIDFEKRDGQHYFDVTAFLDRKRVPLEFISSDKYRKAKGFISLRRADLIVSDNGFYELRSLWMDTWVYYLTTYYKPGVLKVQGFNIRKASFGDAGRVLTSRELAKIICKSLEGPLEIGADEIKCLIDRFHHHIDFSVYNRREQFAAWPDDGRILTWEEYVAEDDARAELGLETET